MTTNNNNIPRVSRARKHFGGSLRSALARESTRYLLHYVHVGGLWIEATDGRRAHRFHRSILECNEGFYSLDKRGALVATDAQGNYPRIDLVIPDFQTARSSFVVDADKLRRAAILADRQARDWDKAHRDALGRANRRQADNEPTRGLLIYNVNRTLGLIVVHKEFGAVGFNTTRGCRTLAGINPRFIVDACTFLQRLGDDSPRFYWFGHVARNRVYETTNRPLLFVGTYTQAMIAPALIPENAAQMIADAMGGES